MRPPVFPSIGATLEYSSDGGATWVTVPNIGEVDVSGGEAPEADIVTFAGVSKVAGHTRAPSMTVELPALAVTTSAVKGLRTHQISGAVLRWRLTTKEDILFTSPDSGPTVAIATDGVATFAGTGAPIFSGDSVYSEGYILELMGGTQYVLDKITDAGVVTVAPAPASAVPAEDQFTLRVPSLRSLFEGSVRSGPANVFGLAAENALSGSLGISLRGRLPDWVIV